MGGPVPSRSSRRSSSFGVAVTRSRTGNRRFLCLEADTLTETEPEGRARYSVDARHRAQSTARQEERDDERPERVACAHRLLTNFARPASSAIACFRPRPTAVRARLDPLAPACLSPLLSAPSSLHPSQQTTCPPPARTVAQTSFIPSTALPPSSSLVVTRGARARRSRRKLKLSRVSFMLCTRRWQKDASTLFAGRLTWYVLRYFRDRELFMAVWRTRYLSDFELCSFVGFGYVSVALGQFLFNRFGYL